jgi:hypothetical protein
VLAAIRNHRPEKIFLHTNVKFIGIPLGQNQKYFVGSVLEVKNITLPTEIFGQKFSKNYHLWHAGDVTRIKILMQYGGIFLENDSYGARNVDVFRNHETTIGMTDGYKLGTQDLKAHKDARYLRLCLECYRDYIADSWYYNAGEKPMREVDI